MIEYPDLHDARVANKSLRDIFLADFEGFRNTGARTKIQQLCWLANSVVDDYCSERINAIERYADALFSGHEHKKWDRAGMTGAEFLRMSILRALDAHERQLGHIEAVRRAGGEDAYLNSLMRKPD